MVRPLTVVAALAVALAADRAHAQQARDLGVLAEVGQGGITTIRPRVSINDLGYVAFAARYSAPGGERENLLVVTPEGSVSRLVLDQHTVRNNGLDPARQEFNGGVQINNQLQVVARRRHDVTVQVAPPLGQILEAPFTYLERWHAQGGLPSRVAFGDAGAAPALPLITILNPLWALQFPSGIVYGSEFAGIYGDVSISNVGNGVVFAAIAQGTNVNQLATSTTAGGFKITLNAELPRPQLADTNEFVMRLGASNGSIVVLPPAFLPFVATIAGGATGFTAVGKAPGITDAGNVVAFAGTKDGADGVYISLRQGAFQAPVLIAGGPAMLGGFEAVELDQRVGVNRLVGSCCPDYAVMFAATHREGTRAVRGVYRAWVDASVTPPTVLQYKTIVEVGDEVRGLPGEVSDFTLHDPVNNKGQGAFYLTTNALAAAVVTTDLRGVQVVDLANDCFFSGTSCLLPGWDIRTLYANVGERRVGLAADGVTPVMLRSGDYPAGGTLTITVKDEFNSTDPGRVGLLESLLAPGQAANPLILPLVDIPVTGGKRAFARLTAPMNFVRPGVPADEQLGLNNPRRLTIVTQYTPPSGPMPDPVTQQIELHRPPVVLVHGLHDGPAAWTGWPLAADPRFLVGRANYVATHDTSFEFNVPAVHEAIESALDAARHRRIASTQADVFGHSMGGLLTRLYALDTSPAGSPTGFKSVRNFNKGSIHKLITVNTPHLGSQASAILVNLQNQPLSSSELNFYWPVAVRGGDCFVPCEFPPAVLTPTDGNILRGAVRDLRPDSPPISRLRTTPGPLVIPSHAIYGNGDTDNIDHCYAEQKRFMLGIGCAGRTLSQLFGGPNDGAVSVVSQLGGLPPTPTGQAGPSFLVTGREGLHWPIVVEFPSGPAAQHAVTLLNAPVDSAYFAQGFPVGVPPLPLPAPCLDTGTAGFVGQLIATPLGTRVILEVIVTAPIPIPGLTTYVLASETGRLLACLGGREVYETDLPDDVVGEVRYTAYALVNGVYRDKIGSATVLVAAPSPLVGLTCQPQELTFDRAGAERNLLPIGAYADGRSRYLHRPGAGTTYSVADPGVAWVGPDGIVRSVGPGQTIVLVENGAFSTEVRVRVTPAACYANCDNSATPPILNVNDFICFQTKYAAADPAANCDGSTTPPILNVNDFICFQTKYAQGCP